MHHHLRLPVAVVLAEYCQADDLIGMRFDFRQRSIKIKKQAYFADSSGVSVNGSVTRFSPSLFLLCCAERALQTCKYRHVTGVAICNEEQPTVMAVGYVGKNAKLLQKKASDSAFRFLL